MEAVSENLSEKAKKVYEYLSTVKEASKPKIKAEMGLQTDNDYSEIRSELLEKRLVSAKKGRFDGLKLITSGNQGKTKENTIVDSAKQTEEQEKIKNLSPQAIKLWTFIPQDGSFATNLSLRHKLRPMGLSTDEFWKYRKELLDNNLITIKRGRGGSVARIQEIVEKEKIKLPPTLVKDESKLYCELRNWLEKNIVAADENSGGQAWSVETGEPKQWKRSTGHWSRPDVVLVEITSYEYLSHRDVAVTTYEIKRYNPQMDNSWVFEAASHSKGAHYSYLVVEVSEDQDTDEPPTELSADLRQFGIGFGWLYFSKETKEYEFHEVLEPNRKNPNPDDENELLKNFVSRLKPAQQTAFKHAIK